MSKKTVNPSVEQLADYFNMRVEGNTLFFTANYDTSQQIAAELKNIQAPIDRHRIYVGNQITFSEKTDLNAFIESGKIRTLLIADWMKNYLNQFISGSERGYLSPPTGAEEI